VEATDLFVREFVLQDDTAKRAWNNMLDSLLADESWSDDDTRVLVDMYGYAIDLKVFEVPGIDGFSVPTTVMKRLEDMGRARLGRQPNRNYKITLT
jgi:hypothetical protein